ncbi:MerR family transcriptional regulator [Roseateles amylovorans]|uniref:MerR family transcriptional regulator n=1 Tax=Roseateles amylovorans TaxID=2978473 RepID=A0ABY6B1D5_9BURK|nr:hypothetical protein [Roseateles amylovorans]UXH77135.1 hypothetical protein N4261_19265 [Roseateles amylovorans]
MKQAVHIAGIPPSLIETLIDEELLQPGAKMRFTFQDLVLLQSARQLMDAGLPTHRILNALSNVRKTVVPQAHLAALKFKSPSQRVLAS